MKYLTRELYEKSIIELRIEQYNYMFKNIEKLEQFQCFYNEEEIRKEFEELKPYILKYCPKSLVDSVNDGSILEHNSPSNYTRSELRKWLGAISKEYTKAIEEGNKNLKSIEKKLPDDLLDYVKNYSFHDCYINGIDVNEEKMVIIHIKGDGTYIKDDKYKIIFHEVCDISIDNDIKNSQLFYEEIELLEDKSFEIRMFTWGKDGIIPLKEVKIKARKISVIISEGII